MPRMNLFAAAAALLALSACAPIDQPEPVPVPPAVAAEGVTVTKLNGRFLSFVGPKRQHAEAYLDVPNTNYYCLRSFVDARSGEAVHQLYVQYSHLGPYKWTGARDQAKKKLRFIPLTQNEITCEGGCSYADEFAAALPEEMLRRIPDGLAVTFTQGGKGGDKTITVDKELIAKQIGALDAVRASMKTASAAPAPAGGAAASAPAVKAAPAAAPASEAAAPPATPAPR